MQDKSKALEVAEEAAQKGAEVALSYFKKSKEELLIERKKDRSLLTKADIATEDVIKEHISKHFPNAEFITEEAESTVKNYDEVFVIDPIDGTREFFSGMDLWAILIGYAKQGKFLSGVALFPALDIKLLGEIGKGAYLEKTKINISKESDLSKSFGMNNSLTHFKREGEMEKLLKLVRNIESIRSFNSSYSCYTVVTGSADFFVSNHNHKIWDIGAFVPIIKEAGGKITYWDGGDIDIRREEAPVVVSNGLLHEQVLKALS